MIRISARIKLDLPEPVLPTIPTFSADATFRQTLFKTSGRFGLYRILRLLISILDEVGHDAGGFGVWWSGSRSFASANSSILSTLFIPLSTSPKQKSRKPTKSPETAATESPRLSEVTLLNTSILACLIR